MTVRQSASPLSYLGVLFGDSASMITSRMPVTTMAMATATYGHQSAPVLQRASPTIERQCCVRHAWIIGSNDSPDSAAYGSEPGAKCQLISEKNHRDQQKNQPRSPGPGSQWA